MSHHLETIALHGGYAGDPTSRAAAVPIYRPSSFVFHTTAQTVSPTFSAGAVWANL